MSDDTSAWLIVIGVFFVVAITGLVVSLAHQVREWRQRRAITRRR